MAERVAIPKFIIGLGGLAAPELDDETWFDHVRAGEMFNRAVTNARLTSYFGNAMGAVIQNPINPHYIDEGYGLDYIVPGQEPENDADRIAYHILLRKIKSRDDTIKRLRRVFEGLVSSPERPVPGGKTTEEGKRDRVEGRQNPLAITAE